MVNTRPYTLTLAIFEAAIDFDYAHEDAKQLPYRCELQAYYRPYRDSNDNFSVITNGTIYPTFRDGNFDGWNIESFEPDYIRNSDVFGTMHNEQGYAYICEGDNLDDTHSQIAADTLDELIAELPKQSVIIEYPNGFVHLENYPLNLYKGKTSCTLTTESE